MEKLRDQRRGAPSYNAGDTGDVSQTDLCVLIGNMLENALEACKRLDVGVRRAEDGTILSSKREGPVEGIGLNSIRAIAQKCHGYARFVPGDDSFETSAVVRLHA